MRNYNTNNYMQGTVEIRNPEIERADANLQEAGLNVKNALQELGKAYLEANKDNAESEYYEQITQIKKCMDNEILWRQYRLSLEGKLQCEKCSAVITSDSKFCNQCGGGIRVWDFSGLGVGSSESENAAGTAVCKMCGKPLVPEAAFCEVCGAKV